MTQAENRGELWCVAAVNVLDFENLQKLFEEIHRLIGESVANEKD